MNAQRVALQLNRLSDSYFSYKILELIASSEQKPFTVTEIAQATGVSKNTCRRVLEFLLTKGFVTRDTAGRAMLYTPASGSPALTRFKGFTTILALEPLLKRLRGQTERIVLYGPAADGADTPADPINLFIVAPDPQRVLSITDTWRMPGSGSVGGLRSSNRHTAGVALGKSRGNGNDARIGNGDGKVPAPNPLALNTLPLPTDETGLVTVTGPGELPIADCGMRNAGSGAELVLGAPRGGSAPISADGQTPVPTIGNPQSAIGNSGRRVSAIIMPPAAEIPILTENPETTIKKIEAGIVLWQDPDKPAPHLTTKGGGRHKIAITTTWLKWKKSADPGVGNEPYVISMAFDAHTFKGDQPIEPFFNAMPFPNVVAGDTLPMLGEGHLLYGPRDPGAFVALSVFWMEKDAGARDLGQTISDLQSNKKIKSSLKAIAQLAGEGLAKLLPGVNAVASIVSEALKLNKDDEIFRTDGVYFRDTDPPFRIGSETVQGNVFMDFNLKVIDMGN